jgi:DNA-binding HxlR family transcriptional regulator
MLPTIVEYKERIPHEIRTLLEALSESSRQGLVMMLADRGELSFKEILHLSRPLNPSTLDHHLKELMKAALVKNHYKKVEGRDDYSFYQLTDFGREFLARIGVA